jgi:hypothetical protein
MTEISESTDAPTHAEFLRAHGRELPPAVAQAEQIAAYRAAHAGDDNGWNNIWRTRAARQGAAWDASVRPKFPDAPSTRRPVEEQVDEQRLNEMIERAWERRELAELDLHEHIQELVKKCFA